jgi:hypothetical protein
LVIVITLFIFIKNIGMSIIRKRNKPVREDNFIVVNKDGQAFIGLQGGYPVYSDDWAEAKPLFKDNTEMLLREKGTELLNTSEL